MAHVRRECLAQDGDACCVPSVEERHEAVEKQVGLAARLPSGQGGGRSSHRSRISVGAGHVIGVEGHAHRVKECAPGESHIDESEPLGGLDQTGGRFARSSVS